MPRQHVYGKRSRAVYDPFSVFASPQHAAASAGGVVNNGEKTEQIQKAGHDNGETESPERQRRALGERNANSVVTSRIPHESTKSRRRKAKTARETKNADGPRQSPSSALVIEQSPVHTRASPRVHQSHIKRQRVVDVQPLETHVIEKGISSRDTHHGDGQENEDPATNTMVPTSVDEWEDVVPAVQQLDPTPSGTDSYSTHCAHLLSLGAHSLTSFSEWSEQLSTHFAITKIAEASFGEVYRLSLVEKIDNFSRSDESVFKVIALKPPTSSLPKGKKKRAAALRSAELMSKPEDVANEVKLLQRMSSIPGFTNFRDVRVLQGRPPPAFVEAFREFNVAQKAKQKEASHFPDPGKKASYSEDQLWAVIEMQDAGIDLERHVESGQSTSIWTVWDVFWQVVLTLAKGEEGAEFEHRDLHLGNICVRPRPSSKPDNPSLGKIDVKRNLNFTNLETTIIDYTISRALMCDSSVAYHDLAADTALFEGDSTEEYQYDIYRYMRGAVFLDNALADNSYFANRRCTSSEGAAATWQQYNPVTNLVWLHFVLYKLLEQIEWPSAGKAPSRRQKQAFAEQRRAVALERKLLKVQELLEPEILGRSGVRAASDLVGLALEEGWLNVEDVVGEGGDAEEEGDEEVEVELHAKELVEELQMLVVVDEVATPLEDVDKLLAPARTRRRM